MGLSSWLSWVAQRPRIVRAGARFLFTGCALVLACAFAGAEEIYQFERMWPTLQQPWYFFRPTDIAVHGDNVYVVDAENRRIQRLNRDGQFITLWGGEGLGDGQFQDPSAIAVDSDGNVYVTDSGSDRVQKFAPDGQFIDDWGGTGNGDGKFVTPRGIAIGLLNQIYVVDSGNSRVQEFDTDGNYIDEFGRFGFDDDQFLFPYGIDVGPQGTLYVTDTFNGKVKRFAPDGTPLGEWDGSAGSAGQIVNPWDVTVGSDGRVYVTDTDNDRIQVFSAEGEYVTNWGASGASLGQFRQPVGITTDKSGFVYVVDRLGLNVQQFTAEGAVLNRWGSKGLQPGFMDLPGGVALGPDGDVFVADTENYRVQRFSAEGHFEAQWDGEGSDGGKFELPFGIAVDAAGFVYVVDYDAGNIRKFDQDGGAGVTWGTQGSGDLQFSGPTAAAIDSDGNIYITDSNNDRVQKLGPDGGFIEAWSAASDTPVDLDDPIGIAISSDDRVYVADSGHNRIQEFTTNGTPVRQWNQGQDGDDRFNAPKGIAVDADGNVYLSDTDNHRILKFDPDGGYLATFAREGTNPGDVLHPAGLAVGRVGEAAGRVYVADQFNDRIQVFKPVPVANASKAIICAAGGPFPGNNLWTATQLCANFAYRSLTYQGFTKDSIFYLSADQDLDLDGNGLSDDVDGDATNAELEAAITVWAAAGGTEDVVVYLVDHGGDGSFRMSDTETLAASALDAWLDTLEEQISGTLTVVYEACQSGSFQATLAPSPGQQRIVITSTDLGENAYFLSQGTISFSIFFWTHIFNGENVLQAFLLAQEALTQAVDTQHPLLSDSPGDTTLAADTHLGNGTLIEGDAPHIGAVSEPQTLSQSSAATLWAEPVTDPEGVSRVWAVIRPPDFQPISPDNPVQELPAFDLQPVGGGRFQSSYESFTSQGLYQIAVYARDTAGNTAAPKLTTVSVDSPLRRRAIILGGSGDLTLETQLEADIRQNILSRAYDALRIQGYNDDSIAFRSPVTFQGGIDGAPSLSNLQYLLQDWATFDTHDLVVYLTGPAGAEGLYVNQFEALTPGELDSWLDVAQYTIPGTVTVVLDFTDSGSWLPVLIPPAERQRIVITSTRPAETARFLSNGDLSFSSYFWTSVLNGATVWNAFKHGQIAMRFSGFGQFAALDDTANGVGNEKADGALARNQVIGAGIQLAGDDPVIGSAGVTPDSLNSGTSATIWAEGVTSTGTISRVLAAITPPGGGAPVEVMLEDVGNGRYEALYDSYSIYGEYAISIVAVDSDGNSSLAAEAVLVQQQGPDALEDDDAVSRATLVGINGELTRHNFHEVGDEDWIRFYAQENERITFETLNLEPNCDTEFALFEADGETPILNPDTEEVVEDDNGSINAPASYYQLPVPRTGYYFLRIREVSGGFGAGTGYDVRVQREIGGCVASANITVYVRSGGSPLAGAAVTISTGGLFPFAESVNSGQNGEAVFPSLSEEGVYSVQVQKTGYQPFITSRTLSCGASLSVSATLSATSGGARLGVSPAGLDFGAIALGAARSMNIIVSNTGTDTLSGSASCGAPFSIVGASSYSLSAGQSQSVNVRFTPTSVQSYTGTLLLTGGGAASLPLDGTGFDATAGVVGDVDGDGNINALDAALIELYVQKARNLEAVLETITPHGLTFHENAADVTRSGGITSLDATLLTLEQLMGRTALKDYLITYERPRTHAGDPLQ